MLIHPRISEEPDLPPQSFLVVVMLQIFPMIIQNLIGLSPIPLEGAKGIGSNRKILTYIYRVEFKLHQV